MRGSSRSSVRVTAAEPFPPRGLTNAARGGNVSLPRDSIVTAIASSSDHQLTQFNDGKDRLPWIKFCSGGYRIVSVLIWRWKMKSSHTVIVLLALSITVTTTLAWGDRTDEQTASATARQASQASGSSLPADINPE